MGSQLPKIELEDFGERLHAIIGLDLSGDQVAQLHCHYRELCRWNQRISLIGPAIDSEVIERHYGESLAAVPLIGRQPGCLLDIGSGAGFPALVLAIAIPGLEVTLVEASTRKWSFLKTVCRKAGLSAHCLNARVAPGSIAALPASIDWITTRAVRVASLPLEALAERLSSQGAFLFWAGATDPELPNGLQISCQRSLPGSSSRRILVVGKHSGTDRRE